MGYPMAGHLKKAGHEVTVYNRNGEKAKQWQAEYGGATAATPAEAAKDQDIVFCCVGRDSDLREVTLGRKRRAFAAMKKGALFVDHTTASASIARELAKEAEKRGFDFVDAPVSGGQAGAVNGKLTIMCGGSEAAYARAEPVMARLSRQMKLLGPAGLGPDHQDGQPDLHRRHRPGHGGGLQPGARRRPGRGGGGGGDLQGRGPELADGEPLQDHGGGRIQSRLRGGMDAQGSRHRAGRSAQRNGASLPVTALVDQFYAEVENLGGKRWDTSSLFARQETARKGNKS